MKPDRILASGALAIGLLLLVTGWRALDYRQERTALLDAADARADDLADLLAEYVAGTFAAGDAALRQLTLYAPRVGGVEAADSTWLPMLTQARAGLRGIGAFSVADTGGTVRHSTRPELVGQVRPDRVLREALAADAPDQLIVGIPVRAVVAPFNYIIPLARPMRRADGVVEGAVVASFIATELRAFLKTVDVGTDGRVWVFHPSGVLLVREPSPANPAGESAAGNPIFDAAAGQRDGRVRAPLTPGGAVLRTSFRTVTGAPVYVAVSVDEGEVLAPWQHAVTRSGIALLALSTVLALSLAALLRQARVAATAEQSLAQARVQEAERLRAAHEQLQAAYGREREARAEAERASALKDEFLMTMSHELRTPLNVVLNWAVMLSTNALPDERRPQAVEAVARNARALARLVDDLLDASRGMAGALRLEVGAVVVADVVHAAVDTVALAAHGKDVRLDVHVSPDVGTIAGDAARLQQVVWNLLSNAIKFTPGGGGVSLHATRDGGRVTITVEDTGSGISAAFLPHVFDRFRQEHTGTTREFGGLGLGLAIARHIVELHGGEIEATSSGPGRGARFTVRLSAAAPERTASAVAATHT